MFTFAKNVIIVKGAVKMFVGDCCTSNDNFKQFINIYSCLRRRSHEFTQIHTATRIHEHIRVRGRGKGLIDDGHVELGRSARIIGYFRNRPYLILLLNFFLITSKCYETYLNGVKIEYVFFEEKGCSKTKTGVFFSFLPFFVKINEKMPK